MRTNTTVPAFVALIAGLAMATPLFAHHGDAAYSATIPVRFTRPVRLVSLIKSALSGSRVCSRRSLSDSLRRSR